MDRRTPARPSATAPLDRTEVEPIARLLDDAHASLPTRELAELLVALADLAERAHPDGAGLTAGNRRILGPIERLVRSLSAPDGRGAADPHPASLRTWLRDYADELAARPRGAALPAPG